MIRKARIGDRVMFPGHGSGDKRPGTVIEVGTWSDRSPRIIVRPDGGGSNLQLHPADLERLAELNPLDGLVFACQRLDRAWDEWAGSDDEKPGQFDAVAEAIGDMRRELDRMGVR